MAWGLDVRRFARSKDGSLWFRDFGLSELVQGSRVYLGQKVKGGLGFRGLGFRVRFSAQGFFGHQRRGFNAKDVDRQFIGLCVWGVTVLWSLREF